MSSSIQQRFGGAVAFIAGVGCATPIIDEDPNVMGPAEGASATGGTTVTAGGGTTSAGGNAASAGNTGVQSGTGGSGTVGAAGAPAAAGRTGGVGSAGTLGRNMGGAGRGSSMGGAATSAAGSSAVASCPEPRTPDQPGAMQGNSGSFDTTEAVCYFVLGTFNAWNCSNIAGRSVTINGARSMCGGSLPAKVDGGYYFEFGAASDTTNYTSFYWYTS